MANDARIAIKNRKKNTLNDLLENLTKPKVRDLGYLKEVLTTCWEQINHTAEPDEQGD